MKILLGKKVGMSQVFTENGVAIPVTIVDVSNNVVSKILKTGDKVTHVEIGKDKKKNTIKSDVGNYKDLTYVPVFKTVIKADGTTDYVVGSVLNADTLVVGEEVQVTSTTKGKGFAGVVKRWGFHGGPRTHGASDRERAPGSIGSRTIPGRVFKGLKMAGHMGVRTKTILGLKVIKVMNEDGLVAIKGAIPGNNKSYLIIKVK